MIVNYPVSREAQFVMSLIIWLPIWAWWAYHYLRGEKK